jgi:hypothetical protein
MNKEKNQNSSERSVKDKIKDFSNLLEEIETLNDKKRKLWTEIYENAITDRQNSYAMFAKLTQIVQDKSAEHAIHGKSIASYIERMSKSNDQLIKLAELIAKAETKNNDELTPDDIFEKIKN